VGIFKCAMVVYLGLLVAGCGAVGNRHDATMVNSAQIPSGSGVAVISTGAPSKCFTAATFLKVMAEDSAYRDHDVTDFGVDGYAVKSDFADHQGRLNVLVLPAGNYYLAATVAKPGIKPIRLSRYDFRVAAGETVYLGEYFQSVSCTLHPVAEIRDQEARDRVLLAEKNPALAKATITKRLLRVDGYAVDDEKSH
jgi:hypothetical protein